MTRSVLNFRSKSENKETLEDVKHILEKKILKDKCKHCGKDLEVIEIKFSGHKIPQMCSCLKKIKEEKQKEIAKREKINKLGYLFKQSRLGERFKNSRFENIQLTEHNQHIVTRLKDYCNNFTNKSDSIIISSHPGTGKTLMVASVVNELLSKDIPAVMCVVPDLMAQLKSTFKRDSEINEWQLMNGLIGANMLVLDDLGAEKHTGNSDMDFATEQLFRIINARYNNFKPTLFTTNCSTQELRNKLGNRTVSRIVEMCGTKNMFSLKNEKDWRTCK
jgi:DNA replication protein DnaC